jgi:hypothetical protein
MNENELKDILNNPAVSAEHKERVLQQIGERSGDPGTVMEAELLQSAAKPDLASVSYFDVHAFCTGRGWVKTHGLYDRWLEAYFGTENGRKDAQRITDYMRENDMDEWGHALQEWQGSGWRSTARLIDVLERIAGNWGGCHSEEVVGHATKFLAEMKRRTGR